MDALTPMWQEAFGAWQGVAGVGAGGIGSHPVSTASSQHGSHGVVVIVDDVSVVVVGTVSV